MATVCSHPLDLEEGGQKCLLSKQQLQVPLLASPSTQGRGCKEGKSPPTLPDHNQAATDSDPSTSKSPFRAAAGLALLDFTRLLPLLFLLLLPCVLWPDSTADLLLSTTTVVLLALLFFLAMVSERTPRDHIQMRGRLKAAVWLGSALVNLITAYRVAAIVPFALAVGVWCVAGAFTATVLYVVLVRGWDIAPKPNSTCDNVVDDPAGCTV